MTTMRHFLLAAVLALMVWTSSGMARAQGLQSAWTTDFGPVHINVNGDFNVTGTYPKYQGWLAGRLMPDGRLNLYWMQTSADRACSKRVYGTFHWGIVRWTIARDGTMRGRWTYCNDTADGGEWSARLAAGESPLALLRTTSAPRRPTPPKDQFGEFLKDADKLFDYLNGR